MEEMGKYIGAGLACLGMLGAAVGVGNIFGSFLQGAMRNPSAAQSQLRQPDLRLRRDGSAGHLLPAGRADPAVRGLNHTGGGRLIRIRPLPFSLHLSKGARVP